MMHKYSILMSTAIMYFIHKKLIHRSCVCVIDLYLYIICETLIGKHTTDRDAINTLGLCHIVNL